MRVKHFIGSLFLAAALHAQYIPPSGGGGGGGAVNSVFGRANNVIALTGDYTAAQVTNAVDQTGSYSNPGWITALANAKVTGLTAFATLAPGATSTYVRGDGSLQTLNCAALASVGLFCAGTDAANLTGTVNNLRLPSTISITGPIAASGAGTGAVDLGTGTTPSAPSAGVKSLFFNSGNSNHLSSEDSSGTVKDIEGGIALQTNGTPNGSQATLNLAAGANVTLTDNGSGTVTVAGTGGGAGVSSVGGLTGAVAGGLILLEQHTASSSATLNFTSCFSSSYDYYFVSLINLLPATDSVNFNMRYTTNGGSSYDSSSIYEYADWFWYAPSGGSGNNPGTTVDHIQVAGSAIHNALLGASGNIQFVDPLNASLQKFSFGDVSYYHQSLNSIIRQTGAFRYASTTAVNGFQLYFSSGNIASGTARCYGVAKQ